MSALKLVVVTAGLSVPSSTRLLADRLAEATARDLRETGREVDVRVVELRELARDVADNLVTGFPPPALRDAVRAVEEADGIIAVTPIFSASYSGLFKSFVDVLDRDALTGKPVLVAATGGTARHSLALEHAMRPLFAYLRAVVVPTAVFAASEDWGANGADGSLAGRIARAAGELAESLAGRPAAPRARTAEPEQVVPFAQQLAALRAH
ncbi:oxidoreductase [Kitasatospora phosalacinea]|uniref:Oxidoreductase n=1 Tax=Kitasatospora phosalacinea TaxID=2065 RepID=A0A9W6Q0S3_9ACTN|nr:FMN reductase [Kitasatospora phosalacinea]GLW67855.1 oxidoreductase [Kitasatospora phosalacinea]